MKGGIVIPLSFQKCGKSDWHGWSQTLGSSEPFTMVVLDVMCSWCAPVSVEQENNNKPNQQANNKKNVFCHQGLAWKNLQSSTCFIMIYSKNYQCIYIFLTLFLCGS